MLQNIHTIFIKFVFFQNLAYEYERKKDKVVL